MTTEKLSYHKKPEIYKLLATNIQKQSLHSAVRRLALTSRQTNLERSQISEKLARQFADQKMRILLIKSDPAGVKGDLHGGLTHLMAQLTGRPITAGQVMDYGLLDLFFLIYFQGQTGNLFLTGHDKRVYHGAFHDGILCHLEVPSCDLTRNLPYFESYGFDKIKQLKELSLKKQVPLIDLLIKSDCLGKQDLALGYSSELRRLFLSITEESLASFRFVPARLKHWRRVPALFDHQFIFQNEKLRAHNFVARCIHLNTHQKDSYLYMMARGSHDYKFCHEKTFREVQRLIQILGHQFDQIVIDAPGLSGGQDGEIFSRLSDGVVLVVDGAEDSSAVIQTMMRRLQDANVNVLGTVLN